MITLETIEFGIKNLSIDDLTAFRRWFMDFDADAWDSQIENDAATGKFNALAKEALDEYYAGKATEI